MVFLINEGTAEVLLLEPEPEQPQLVQPSRTEWKREQCDLNQIRYQHRSLEARFQNKRSIMAVPLDHHHVLTGLCHGRSAHEEETSSRRLRCVQEEEE